VPAFDAALYAFHGTAPAWRAPLPRPLSSLFILGALVGLPKTATQARAEAFSGGAPGFAW
jgi:hypothetical protein